MRNGNRSLDNTSLKSAKAQQNNSNMNNSKGYSEKGNSEFGHAQGNSNKSRENKDQEEKGHKDMQKDSQNTIDTSLALTLEEIDSLVFMYQEEKLAMDIYDVFAEQYDSKIFDNISDAEEKHLGTIENILEQYDVNIDDLKSLDDGNFINDDLQSLYDSLIIQGSTSLENALYVGVAIEEVDIADLNAYLQEDLNQNLETAYTHLESGSQNHLTAFNYQLDNGLLL